MENLFTDQEKISILESKGYTVKLVDYTISESAYHNDVEYRDIKVYQVYQGNHAIDFNFQNVGNRQMAQVNEIFYTHLKEALKILLYTAL